VEIALSLQSVSAHCSLAPAGRRRCAAPARRRMAHCGALPGLPGRQYKVLLHVARGCSWTSQEPTRLESAGVYLWRRLQLSHGGAGKICYASRQPRL